MKNNTGTFYNRLNPENLSFKLHRYAVMCRTMQELKLFRIQGEGHPLIFMLQFYLHKAFLNLVHQSGKPIET